MDEGTMNRHSPEVQYFKAVNGPSASCVTGGISTYMTNLWQILLINVAFPKHVGHLNWTIL